MTGLKRAHERLRGLCEIGRLLTSFKGAAETVPKIIAIVRETIPLRTAVVIASMDPPVLLVTRGDEVSDAEVRAAVERARTSCEYLAGAAGVDAEARGARSSTFISLPLVVAGRPPFGAFQLEPRRKLDEDDLAYAGAIAHQLAIAIDLRLDDESDVAPRREDLDDLERVFLWEAEPVADLQHETRQAPLFRFPYVSARAEQLLGYTGLAEDQKGSWIDRVHPEDQAQVLRTLEQVARGEQAPGCVHRCMTAAGDVRWFHTSVHLAQAGPHATRLRGVSVDVTSLKRAEDESRRRLELVHVLTSSPGEGIVAVDHERRVTFLNTSAEQLLGCRAPEVVGRPVHEFLELLSRDGEAAPAGAMRIGEPFREDGSFIRRRDGQRFPASFASAPIVQGGQVTGAVLTFRDILEVKRSERRQRLLAEASVVLASSLDYRNTLAIVGRLAVPVLGDLCIFDELREEGVVERLVVAGVDDEWTQRAAKVAHGVGRPATLISDPCPMMVVPLLAGGRTLGALTLAVAEGERRYSAGDLPLAEDLAHRAALAIDSARVAMAAQRAIRARQDVLAIVSHDLQSPLTAISLNVDFMLMTSRDDTTWIRPLKAMRRSADHMQRMLRDLLDSASIEAHHLSVATEPIEVAPMVSEALDQVEGQAAQKIKLVREVPPDLPQIQADAGRIRQVLINLTANAIKFTAPGGTVTVRAEAGTGAVTFAVSDTGPGIAQPDVGRLFERFYRARSAGKVGTGLGLFIVRGIVEAHGGRIWVESQLGVGSTFYFTVPTVPPPLA